MYVLKTKFSKYVTSVVGDSGMIENDSDRVDKAMRFSTVTEVVMFLRALPPVPQLEQNRLSIHRVDRPPSPLVDMGPVG